MDQKQKKENKIIFAGIGIILAFSAYYIIKGMIADQQNKGDQTETAREKLYTDYQYITASELNKKIIDREEIKLLDVRDEASFKKNHIESSVNINDENFQSTVEKFQPDNFIVIIGYDYNNKTDEAGTIKNLKKLGFTNIRALSGGITGWAEEGENLISAGDKESALDWSKIDQILPEQLKLAIDSQYPVFILDVRQAFLYSNGHIPGAVNIPLEELENRKSELPISKEILVYGSDSDEDFSASVKLNDMGFLATFILQGGFTSWQEKRFDVVK